MATAISSMKIAATPRSRKKSNMLEKRLNR